MQVVNFQTEHNHSSLRQRSPALLPLQQGFSTMLSQHFIFRKPVKDGCSTLVKKVLKRSNPLQQDFSTFYLSKMDVAPWCKHSNPSQKDFSTFYLQKKMDVKSGRVGLDWMDLWKGGGKENLTVLKHPNPLQQRFPTFSLKTFKSPFWKRFCNVVRIDFLSHLSSRLCHVQFFPPPHIIISSEFIDFVCMSNKWEN